ncbi:flavodoxin [Clostridium aceticum]|uniref:Flavodoxin n=1 Tax=Clostridium aceticum TaxID=84022 RepID=A0A0D8I8C5_9CLOT|nr:flavodoxin domain-containing protein [Clostridium aceticum]AKL97262.1 flavodoxin [Clostridium aceticum]KJF26287.1 flavodoxin [Clostridium aceticum]
MKVLILYATKHGATEKCAKILAGKLRGEVDLCNLKAMKSIDFAQYQKVIIGGSVYMGKIQKEVSEFCLKNMNVLKEKEIGLFICCMKDKDDAVTQLQSCFPQEVLMKASVKECFGGEFIFGKMNFIEKFIVKKVAKTDKDLSKISIESIDRFAQAMNGDVRPNKSTK